MLKGMLMINIIAKFIWSMTIYILLLEVIFMVLNFDYFVSECLGFGGTPVSC